MTTITPQESTTVTGGLKLAGCVTGIFGKWHLAGEDGAEPGEQGVDAVFQSQTGWGGNVSQKIRGHLFTNPGRLRVHVKKEGSERLASHNANPDYGKPGKVGKQKRLKGDDADG